MVFRLVQFQPRYIMYYIQVSIHNCKMSFFNLPQEVRYEIYRRSRHYFANDVRNRYFRFVAYGPHRGIARARFMRVRAAIRLQNFGLANRLMRQYGIAVGTDTYGYNATFEERRLIPYGPY